MRCTIRSYQIVTNDWNHPVLEATPDEHYSLDDDRLTLIIKQLGIAAFKNVLSGPIWLLYRVVDLMTGGFYSRGKGIAILLELAKDVCRIALYPIYFLGIELAALIGIFFPYDGRALLSRVDAFFYLAPADMEATPSFLDVFGNLMAPCMQPLEFKKEQNIFRYFPTPTSFKGSMKAWLARVERHWTKLNHFTPTQINALKEQLSCVKTAVQNCKQEPQKTMMDEAFNNLLSQQDYEQIMSTLDKIKQNLSL